MIGVNSAWDVIHIVISALIGMLCFVPHCRVFFKDTAWYSVFMLAAAFCALVPGVHSDGIGLVILITFIFIHSKRHRLYWLNNKKACDTFSQAELFTLVYLTSSLYRLMLVF
ncbi:hypothetical protein GW537_06575 [Piscirickettsia salmonis]|uniref:hypothetical protein n=1 Tax=Piscirickettsia salmonis TaxID=1238 RepID=UPI00137BA7B0|nr:hypothetical protein [Piscirickettsia salmonis]QHS28860.1 hypothetical protein GW537_06575 [Piscirickettsia salmonis]